jgi:hypothetical protein
MENQSILCVDDEDIILFALKNSLQYHFGNRFSYKIASSFERRIKNHGRIKQGRYANTISQ